MLILNNLYARFRRVTNTVAFIPAIDGLRFIAIAAVVITHVRGFLLFKLAAPGTVDVTSYFDLLGRKGVLLFFVISGFILGLPFARHYIQGAQKVDLKKYFLRRFTRLEPPYFLTMISCFLLLTWKYHLSFKIYLGSLLASLVYLHNVLPVYSSVNQVAWSLEVEIQFYLLVPFLVMVYRLAAYQRRLLFATIILIFPLLQFLFPASKETLYSFIQYFVAGMLLADLFLCNISFASLKGWSSAFIGGVCFFLIFSLPIYRSFVWEAVFIFLVVGFYLLVLTHKFWKLIFSFGLLTSIGGMCYTIYLWHDIIMSGVGSIVLKFKLFNIYALNFTFRFGVITLAILAFSSLFYLFIERPCMDRQWPLKLLRAVREKFSA